MTKSHNDNNDINILADEIRNQFVKIGEDVASQIVEDFNQTLTSDVNDLKSSFNLRLAEENKKIMERARRQLQKLINEQFKGNIFGEIFTDAVLPTIFEGALGSINKNAGLNQTTGQKLFNLGKAISRFQGRNG